MPLTRSNNKTVAAVQHLGQEVACTITQLGEYLKGLATSQDPDWMGRIKEWIRWILEKMRQLYQRMALAIGCKRSSLGNSIQITEATASTKEEILKAVETAKHRATDLMYGVRASIYEVLETVKAWILKLRTKEEDTKAEKEEETEAIKEEGNDENDAEAGDSEDEGPADKKIKLE